jgi:hypothetical protein
MLLSSVENTRGLFNYRASPAHDVAQRDSKKLREMERESRYYIQFMNELVVKNQLFPRYPVAPGNRDGK